MNRPQSKRLQIYAAAADEAAADILARALHAEGCHIVNGSFDPARADAVIVLWSPASVRSQKLVAAAHAPLAAGALIPVSIGAAEPPEGFRHLAPAGLDGWKGEPDDPRWRFVMDEVDRIAAARGLPGSSSRIQGDSDRLWGEAPSASALAGAALAARSRFAGALLRQPGLVFGLALTAAAIVAGFVSLVMRLPERPAPVEADHPPAAVAEGAPPLLARLSVREADPPPDGDGDQPTEGVINETPADEQNDAPAQDAIAELIVSSDDGAAFEPGEQIRDCETCPELVVIPGGSFEMGAPPEEPQRRLSEGPVVEIAVAPFALGVSEVTFAEWDACVAANACPSLPDSGWGRGRQPAVNVSYDDALAYVAWLSQVSGKAYRLPTEAEWEYAARAGATTPFSFGATVSAAQANFDGALPYGAPPGEFRGKPQIAGSYGANPFGLYDMHGNVWEWVADCWTPSHEGQPSDGSARGGACSQRVLKGGAWNTGGWRLRAAHRIPKPATAREYDNGFRVARDLE